MKADLIVFQTHYQKNRTKITVFTFFGFTGFGYIDAT